MQTLSISAGRTDHLDLRQTDVVNIPRPAGVRLTCTSGTAWVTQGHQSRGLALYPGQVLVLDRRKPVYVSACRNARCGWMVLPSRRRHGHAARRRSPPGGSARPAPPPEADDMGPALAAQHLALEALGDPITPLPAAMPTKAPIGSAWRPRRDAVRFLRSPVVAIVALALRLLCRWSGRVGQRCKEVDATLRTVGSFPSYDGTLVVSGAETGGDPIVLRLQFFELFGPDGQLRWKRLLPMRFAFIDRDAFEAIATAAGFRVVALMGDYAGRPFEPESSPVMIRTPERPG